MKIHRYRNYEEYRRIQTNTNKDKIDKRWVTRENISLLSSYLKKNVPNMTFGICHGTRRGDEQAWFREDLGIEVIGTEISDTATEFPHTIQWDFHDVKEEWKKSVDFIYSNSLDHSYKPRECLRTWLSCLKPTGVCIVEYSGWSCIAESSYTDPFGASLHEYCLLARSVGTLALVIPGNTTGDSWREECIPSWFLVIRPQKSWHYLWAAPLWWIKTITAKLTTKFF